MFETEKTLEITKDDSPWAPEEELGTYKLKRWDWASKQKATELATIIIDRKKGKIEMDTAEYYKQMMFRCIVEAPEGIKDKDGNLTLARLAKLDAHVGDKIVDALREINGLVWEEQRLFLGQSEPENPTPG